MFRKKEKINHAGLTNKHSPSIYSALPVTLTKGKRIYLWDTEGKKYFDCLSCYSAVNQGHCHPKIKKAAIEQMNRLTATSRAFHNDKLGLLLKKLSEITGLPKIIMKNSGAEGVETAIKAMRRWGSEIKGVENPKIIVMENNFHGRTTTIIGFSSDENSRRGFGPFDNGFITVPYNNLDAVINALDNDVVGILVEPIQGEAGVIIPQDNYLIQLSEFCKREKILLAVDEIQTGFGRTGHMLYHRHNNMVTVENNINKYIGTLPDIIILGKALSGGFYPVSACCMTREVGDVFTPGSDGSTYGGNPLACAISLEAIDVIEKEFLCYNSHKIGSEILNKLNGRLCDVSYIKEIRGKGLFIAIEFKKPIAKEVCLGLMSRGVLCKDTHGTTIRLSPPLVIKEREADRLVKILEEFFHEIY